MVETLIEEPVDPVVEQDVHNIMLVAVEQELVVNMEMPVVIVLVTF